MDLLDREMLRVEVGIANGNGNGTGVRLIVVDLATAAIPAEEVIETVETVVIETENEEEEVRGNENEEEEAIETGRAIEEGTEAGRAWGWLEGLVVGVWTIEMWPRLYMEVESMEEEAERQAEEGEEEESEEGLALVRDVEEIVFANRIEVEK